MLALLVLCDAGQHAWPSGALDVHAGLLSSWLLCDLARGLTLRWTPVLDRLISTGGASRRWFGLTVAVLCLAVFEPSLALPGLCSFLRVTQYLQQQSHSPPRLCGCCSAFSELRRMHVCMVCSASMCHSMCFCGGVT